MVLRVYDGIKWHDVGALYHKGESVIDIGPRGSARIGILDSVTTENLERLQLVIPVDGDISYYLYNSLNLTEFSNYNLSRAGLAESMLRNCSNLQIVENIDLSNARNVDSLFMNCDSLQTVNNVTLTRAGSLYRLFYGCTSLHTVHLNNLYNVGSVDGLMRNANNLQSITLGGLGVKEQSNINLRRVDVSHTQLNGAAMDALVASLGVTGDLDTPWVLRYNSNLVWDTSAATDKGWVLEPQ